MTGRSRAIFLALRTDSASLDAIRRARRNYIVRGMELFVLPRQW